MEVFIISVFVVFIAEMGDKTQFGVFSLALKFDRYRVLLGAIAGFALMTLLAVIFGEFVVRLIPQNIITTTAAVLFIILGLYFIFSKGETKEESGARKGNPVLVSFLLVSSAELGDKTQLLIGALAIKYAAPLLVFAGALTGLVLASLLGILIAPIIKNRLAWIEKAAGLVMVVIGIFMFLRR